MNLWAIILQSEIGIIAQRFIAGEQIEPQFFPSNELLGY